ncbi:hypothetical protein FQA47_023144 [Oryzias melastigma]|uniref:Uncharacterized protein n=1 Tax=Oryzias melastigma TaxID=30732 RepID=A0A834CE47_ORYME|nr:hypothetical protein FQA47_023144 [Oryzias melastigma]
MLEELSCSIVGTDGSRTTRLNARSGPRSDSEPPASVLVEFDALRLPPTAGNLPQGSMVFSFYCNKWIRGGDPTKPAPQTMNASSSALLPSKRLNATLAYLLC